MLDFEIPIITTDGVFQTDELSATGYAKQTVGTVLERNHHCVRKRPGKNRANDYLKVTEFHNRLYRLTCL